MANQHLDICAQEIGAYAAKARYVALAARCMENGTPAAPEVRQECMIYLMEVVEELSAQAETAAADLQYALEQRARA